MNRYAVLGNPISHSRSPWIHARFAEQCEIELKYEAIEVPLDGFEQVVEELIQQGFSGCNVTVPFKEAAYRLAQQSSPHSALAKAANTLIFRNTHIEAHNTDGIGLVRDLTRNTKFNLEQKRIALLGAGGAAAGVLSLLIEAKPESITLANRTVAKAERLAMSHAFLAQKFNVNCTACSLAELGGEFDLVMNATASSLYNEPLPLGKVKLNRAALVYDMMYGEKAQSFLGWGQTRGAVTQDGLGMLVEQAAETFYLWHGVLPKTEALLAELRKAL